MNYAKFLNAVSLAREPSPIRLLTALKARSGPSMISLAGGNPNPLCFPFQEADIKLRDGTVLHLSEERMKVALQYDATAGIVDLLNFLKNLQKKLHNPPNFGRTPLQGGIDICVTPGSMDGINKSFEMLVNPGDSVLIESPTYAGTISALRPLGCRLLPVETDHNGIIPTSLNEALTRCKALFDGPQKQPMPKLLYTIPNGTNPTGATTPIERKHAVYKIAKEYDLLILEDDPYYFLQFNMPRIPSYLSIDEDGRVLRFDSFSKIMSSGLRLGFVTGPQPLVERIILHLMVSVMHTSTLSQVMVSDLLYRWGLEGFENHVAKVVEFYRNQKDMMILAADKWLKGLAEWNEPQAGMFLWFKINGVSDTKRMIEEKAQKKEVLLVPGYAFMTDPSAASPHVRASYSIATEEEMNKGFQRLSELIKDELAETSQNRYSN